MKTKFILPAIIISLAALSASCGGKQEATTEKPVVVQGVRVEKIVPAEVDDFYEASGTVRSKTTTIISSKIMGAVTSLRVGEGDRVRAGQLLIEIENRDAAAQLLKAQAGLREAEESLGEVDQSIEAAKSARAAADAGRQLALATYNRYQTLLERKSISQQEFDEVKAKRQVADAEAERAERMLQMMTARRNQVRARIDQAKADIANAQVYVGYGRIYSPINGLVTAKTTELGSTAAPGAPLLTIENGDSYRLEANVEESKFGRIRRGDRVLVTIDALGLRDVEAKVDEIVPTADPSSRSYVVKVDLPGRELIRSGVYGTARFAMGKKESVLIPEKSIVRRGQLVGVYVVDDSGAAHLRLIRTGKQYGDSLEALSGVNAGESIAVEGVARLSDGSRVR